MKLVCTICGADAKLADDGFYRHANQPFEDQSTFCDRYGYPIRVVQIEEKPEFERVARWMARSLELFVVTCAWFMLGFIAGFLYRGEWRIAAVLGVVLGVVIVAILILVSS